METARVPAKLLHGSADDAPPSNLGVACDDVTHLSAGGGDLVALVVDSGLRVVVVQLSPTPTILQRVRECEVEVPRMLAWAQVRP